MPSLLSLTGSCASLTAPGAQSRMQAINRVAKAACLPRLLLGLAAAALALAIQAPAFAATLLSSTRVWPAEEYTRVTLESVVQVKHQFLALNNPQRLVLDLLDVEPNEELQALALRVAATDPYIKSVRVGRFKPGVMRLVFDLKTEARANVFALPPVGEYGHRLVLDIYPARPRDPLMALLTEAEKKADAGGSNTAETTGSTAAELNLPGSNPLGSNPKAADAAGSESGAFNGGQILEGRQAADVRGGTSEKTVTLASPPSRFEEPQRAQLSDESIEGDGRQIDDKFPGSNSASKKRRPVIIAIDAGHGGEDPGAHGARGSLEKHITLALARKLKARIEAVPNMRAILIRDGDYFVSLYDRTVKARRAQADLFVSIHADAFVTREARGSSVFALSENGATSAAARWLATKENEADLIGGVNLAVKDRYLARTLLDLSQTATINDSLKLGKAVLNEIGDINHLHKNYVEQAGFAVLKSPDIPSILVETAFISNPQEEKKLADGRHQDKLADALLSGIKRYFAKNPALSKPKLVKND